jgi:hypothetical protein
MIVREFYTQREDGVDLFKIYSDKNLKIQKVGTSEVYDVAVDVSTAPWHYIETQAPILEDILAEETQELTQEEIATMLEEVF